MALFGRGPQGYSAYEIAVKNGFSGTEAQWLESLKGQAIVLSSYPKLSEERQLQLVELAKKYWDAAKQGKFIYNYGATRDVYASKERFNADGLCKVNCGLLCQLLWMGVSPESLFAKNYSGKIFKEFDWGYEFKFPNRAAAYGVKNSNGGYYQYHKNGDEIANSYSANSFYSPSANNDKKQVFFNFCYAADMANELFLSGCEIPISDISIGDLIFYEANHLRDGSSDEFEQMAFRRIYHVAMVVDTDYKGNLKIIEGTSTSKRPIVYRSLSNESGEDRVRMANLNNTIVMVARHPSVMRGLSGNVGDIFTLMKTP